MGDRDRLSDSEFARQIRCYRVGFSDAHGAALRDGRVRRLGTRHGLVDGGLDVLRHRVRDVLGRRDFDRDLGDDRERGRPCHDDGLAADGRGLRDWA